LLRALIRLAGIIQSERPFFIAGRLAARATNCGKTAIQRFSKIEQDWKNSPGKTIPLARNLSSIHSVCGSSIARPYRWMRMEESHEHY
jgi:hypothetical protein